MAIVKIDPENYEHASTVQLDSDAGNMWLAMSEIEDWAGQHQFVRTGEMQLRVVLVGGHRHYRGICFRISSEEEASAEQLHREAIDRGERIADLIRSSPRSNR
jgi:hypothetical protein